MLWSLKCLLFDIALRQPRARYGPGMAAKFGNDLVTCGHPHVVNARASAARNLARGGDQEIAELAGLDESDVALGSDRLLVMAVTGKGEGGIGERKDEAAMRDPLAVHHMRLNGHGQRRAAGPDLDDLHAEAGGRVVFLPHRIRTSLREIIERRAGVHVHDLSPITHHT